MSTMKYASLVLGTVEAVFNKLGGLEGAAQFLRDELVLISKPKLKPLPEPMLDFIVRVDRSIKPSYPDWMREVMHPELECSGPTKFDLRDVSLWLATGQDTGVVTGGVIYSQLKRENILQSCINLQDGLAIQQKGIVVFRKLFAGKVVFLWGSIIEDCNGNLNVPCLFEDGDEVVVD